MKDKDTVNAYLKRIDEAARSADLALIGYIALAFAAAVVSFSDHVPSLTLPFVGIKIDRWNGAELLLVFAFALLLRASCFHAVTLQLECEIKKIDATVNQRTLRPPSVFDVLYPLNEKVRDALFYFFGLLALVVPILLVAHLGISQFTEDHGAPDSWKTTTAIDFVLLCLTTAVRLLLTPGPQARTSKP